jgi:L,D-peptidoglycan transpeptidase YkuD (ErfK/YbiS/YcfS/YnhG family)
MQKRKRWLLILLAILLLTGCGQGKVEGTDYNEKEDTLTEENKNTQDDQDLENIQNSENDQDTEEIQDTQAAPVYSITEINDVLITTVKLNVRDLPSQEGEVINSIPKHTKVEITGKCVETGWYRVMYQGVEGYASNEYFVSEDSLSWVSKLDVAKEVSQIIVVTADKMGTIDVTVSMHTKNENGVWIENYSTPGQIGRNGLGKEREGDGKTPIGIFTFTKAFGILPNPGITSMPYLQVDETHHWVDDPESKFYNQCVSTRDVEPDWNSTEHLYKYVGDYNYSLATSYNKECTPYVGCAIFLHCTVKDFRPTSGCIAIPEEYMAETMVQLRSDCIIVIDLAENINSY